MDDKFDLILVSNTLHQNYIENSYTAFGNEGQNRLNSSIDNPPNTLVSQQMAQALRCASDHLPIYADFTVSTPVSIHESVDTSPLLIYPMPVTDQAVIEVSLPYKHSQIAILDILGRTVFTSTVSGHQTIPLPALKPGFYLCRLEGTVTLTRTFIVQ